MKNIAILTCLKANDVCTGASCLDALYNKKGFFTQYTNDDTKLVAFWTCNGCDEVLLNNQEGLLEKLEGSIINVGVRENSLASTF
ncbi:CGGC domain-containing protein, partial [Megamonas funiformis]|uniref:CGGC domain-containing protein n=1 Tax=Megamonas funiformis TaxID=437897 RepID=UPI00265E59FF